jgi:hypothetical protein
MHGMPTTTVTDTLKRLEAEYRVERTGRLSGRPRLLRILEHMHRGNRLVALMGEGRVSLWLDGFPDINAYAGTLLGYGYLAIAGRAEDSTRIVYLTLNEKGRAKLQEGREWWRSLSLGQRLATMVTG